MVWQNYNFCRSNPTYSGTKEHAEIFFSYVISRNFILNLFGKIEEQAHILFFDCVLLMSCFMASTSILPPRFSTRVGEGLGACKITKISNFH